MIDRQTLSEMRLRAEMCDDYSRYNHEMAYIRELEGMLHEDEEVHLIERPKPIPKVSPKSVSCRTMGEAMDALDHIFSRTKNKVA